MPQTGWLKKETRVFSQFRRSPGSRCPGLVFSEASLLGSLIATLVLPLCAYSPGVSSSMGTPVVRSHVWRYWGLGLQHMKLGACESPQQRGKGQGSTARAARSAEPRHLGGEDTGSLSDHAGQTTGTEGVSLTGGSHRRAGTHSGFMLSLVLAQKQPRLQPQDRLCHRPRLSQAPPSPGPPALLSLAGQERRLGGGWESGAAPRLSALPRPPA